MIPEPVSCLSSKSSFSYFVKIELYDIVNRCSTPMPQSPVSISCPFLPSFAYEFSFLSARQKIRKLSDLHNRWKNVEIVTPKHRFPFQTFSFLPLLVVLCESILQNLFEILRKRNFERTEYSLKMFGQKIASIFYKIKCLWLNQSK